MNHPNLQQFFDILDNDPSNKSVIELKKHVLGCAVCEEELKQLSSIHNKLYNIPLLEAPLQCNELVFSRIDKSSLAMKRNRRFIGAIFSGFIILMLISIASFLYAVFNFKIDELTVKAFSINSDYVVHILELCPQYIKHYFPDTIMISMEIIVVSSIISVFEQFKKLQNKQ